MTRGPLHPTVGAPAHALEQFIALSTRGIEACEHGDPDALAALLDARALVVAGLRGAEVRTHATGASHPGADALLGLARRAQECNTALMQRADQLRRSLQHELARLDRDGLAGEAYADAGPRPSLLDLRR